MAADTVIGRMEEGKPTPDPTVLTTEQLLREIDRLETLMASQVDGLQALINEKISGVVNASELMTVVRNEKIAAVTGEIAGAQARMAESICQVRTFIIEKIEGVEELTKEKLVSVDTQFSLIERQRVEQKADTKAAVDAALAAAKEAVKEQTTASDRSITKSETATSEQLKQMNVTFTTAIAGITSPISDLKDRVTALEAIRLGAYENRGENRDSKADSRANIAIAISVGLGLLTILTMILINAIHIAGH